MHKNNIDNMKGKLFWTNFLIVIFTNIDIYLFLNARMLK